MGASYSSSLLVGFRVSDILEIRQVKETIQKFDENTGKPYTKEIVKEVPFLFGKAIEQEPESPSEWLESLLGLSVSCTGNDAYDGGYGKNSGWSKYNLELFVVGKSISSSRPNGGWRGEEPISTFTLEDVQTAFAEAKKEFAKHGWDKKPQLHLISYCGY